jgi:hypothetical protein
MKNKMFEPQRRKDAEIFEKEKYRDSRINRDYKNYFLIPIHPVIPVFLFLCVFASLR